MIQSIKNVPAYPHSQMLVLLIAWNALIVVKDALAQQVIVPRAILLEQTDWIIQEPLIPVHARMGILMMA